MFTVSDSNVVDWGHRYFYVNNDEHKDEKGQDTHLKNLDMYGCVCWCIYSFNGPMDVGCQCNVASTIIKKYNNVLLG